MSEERLKEIKDMIDSDYDFCRKLGIDFAVPEKELELYNEVISLQKRNKEIYDGFMAIQEELSDYAKENERLKRRLATKKLFKKYKVQTPENFEIRKIFELQRRIEKAVEYIKEDMYSEPSELYGLVDGYHLLNILNGKE